MTGNYNAGDEYREVKKSTARLFLVGHVGVVSHSQYRRWNVTIMPLTVASSPSAGVSRYKRRFRELPVIGAARSSTTGAQLLTGTV